MLDQKIMPGQAGMPTLRYNLDRAQSACLSCLHLGMAVPRFPLSPTNSWRVTKRYALGFAEQEVWYVGILAPFLSNGGEILEC